MERLLRQDGVKNPLRPLYLWILKWADHPAGAWALAVFAFIDSSVFPIPPLFLQIALSLKRPKKSWWYAFIDTVASVAGAVVGYLLGRFLFDTVGRWVIDTFGYQDEFARIGTELQANAFVFILLWSFLPFPYKVITIGSGVYSQYVGLPTLLIASTIGRATRFNILAAITYFWGERAEQIIEKHFNKACVAVGLLVVAVVVVMKVLLKR